LRYAGTLMNSNGSLRFTDDAFNAVVHVIIETKRRSPLNSQYVYPAKHVLQQSIILTFFVPCHHFKSQQHHSNLLFQIIACLGSVYYM